MHWSHWHSVTRLNCTAQTMEPKTVVWCIRVFPNVVCSLFTSFTRPIMQKLKCGCTRDRTHSVVACADHGHCWLLREDAGFGSLHCSVLPRRRMPAVVFNAEMLQSSLVARADGSLMYQSSRMVADVREVKRSPMFVTRSVRYSVSRPPPPGIAGPANTASETNYSTFKHV